jgi:hypothetical protein
VVHPIDQQAAMIDQLLQDPAMRNLYFDISWDEVAKYIVSSDSALARSVRLVEKYPDRFLFGTDNVAPATQAKHMKVYDLYAPFWAKLKPATSLAIRKGNYERLFDRARTRVRAWEAVNVPKERPIPAPTPASGAGK